MRHIPLTEVPVKEEMPQSIRDEQDHRLNTVKGER